MNPIALWPFASSWMLLWGLAAIVPLLIHLWSRRRYDELPWAAMEFLWAALRKNARRLRFEQWLLLALRMLILVLLAAALADPVLSLIGPLGGSSPIGGNTHTVLVLDASYSMDYRQTDETRFDQARRLAQQLVRDSVQGDGFTLVRLAAPPDVVVGEPAFDPEDMLRELDDLRRTDGGGDLMATLAEVERVLDRAAEREPRLQRRRVCFFTDLGRTTWGESASRPARAAIARLAEKADLRMFDVGQPGGQNVAVTHLSAAPGVVTTGHPTRLSIELEDFGNQDHTRRNVDVLVDGQRVADEPVAVSAGGRATVAITHVFQMPGEHVVEIRAGEDRLEADNHRWLSLPVRSAVQVLCVEGKSGAAKNVAYALEPGMSQRPRIRPVIEGETALLERDLDTFDCLFLCNVGRFGRDETRALADYLAHGGGIVFFLGDQVQVANYNQVLGGKDNAMGVLHAKLQPAVASGEYFFDPLDYQHPIVAPFRGNERAGLLTTPVWKYFPLVLPADRGPRVALAFQNGDPAILEYSVGRGQVIVVATAASTTSVDRSTVPPTPWSALPAWPSFPPLIQQMLLSALDRRLELRNTMVGGSISGTLPVDVADGLIVVRDPTGRERRVSVRQGRRDGQWVYTQTATSGIYSVRFGGPEGDIRQYAVNLDTQESQLDRFDFELLPSQFRRDPDAASKPAPDLAGPGPVPLFRFLLAAVLGLALGETFLAWFFGRSAG